MQNSVGKKKQEKKDQFLSVNSLKKYRCIYFKCIVLKLTHKFHTIQKTDKFQKSGGSRVKVHCAFIHHLFAGVRSLYCSEYEMLWLRPIRLCSTPLLNQITEVTDLILE